MCILDFETATVVTNICGAELVPWSAGKAWFHLWGVGGRFLPHCHIAIAIAIAIVNIDIYKKITQCSYPVSIVAAGPCADIFNRFQPSEYVPDIFGFTFTIQLSLISRYPDFVFNTFLAPPKALTVMMFYQLWPPTGALIVIVFYSKSSSKSHGNFENTLGKIPALK